MNYKKIKTCILGAIIRINKPNKRYKLRLGLYKKLL